MISKRKIDKRKKRKQDSYIVDTILAAKKNKDWYKLAKIISGPRRKYTSVNLKEIEKQTAKGDTVVVVGKVLGTGNITKKVRVCALHFSESAAEKLKEEKGEVVTIIEEINKNPKAEGIKVIR